MGITLDYTTKIVSITSPTTQITIQELVDAIRQSEDDLINMSYPKVIDAVGKDDLGGSVSTAITLTLSNLWQIQYWNGVTIGIIKDGNIVGGVGGEPLKPTGGADTLVINNQVGGVIVATGSGVTDQDKTDIIDGVWDEGKSGHTASGTTGEAISALPSGMAKGEAVLGFSFMILDTDGNPATGETVSGQISKDGNSFNALSGITEIGLGFYKINLSSDNMNADTIGLVFTATGCRQTSISIVTT